MISEGIAIQALRKERHYWTRQLETEYVGGIRRGLEIAIKIIQNVSRISPEAQAIYLSRLHGWNAAKLYQTLTTALNLLKLGNRSKAIDRLQREVKQEQS